MRLTGPQIAAALALTGLTREALCKDAAIAKNTLNNILNDTAAYREDTIRRIRSILETRGIEFTENQGVRMKATGVDVYEGPERFNEFYDFLYEHIKKNGGDICLSISDERLLSKYRKDPMVHYERMQDLSDRGVIKSFRILANKSNFTSKYLYNTYKWQPDASVAPTAFYTFGDCLALISFAHSPAPYVVVLQSAPIAQSYRQAFDIAWAVAKEPPASKDER
jgi:transcriptional regulator with XRE-family HTH domain